MRNTFGEMTHREKLTGSICIPSISAGRLPMTKASLADGGMMTGIDLSLPQRFHRLYPTVAENGSHA